MTVETAGAYLVRKMTEHGFKSSPDLHASLVQFHADYADENGRIIRVTVFFDKPFVGMAGVRISGITVTTQSTISPEFSAVEQLAPEVTQEDLKAVLSTFSPTEPVRQSVDVRVCVKCKCASSAFFLINDDAVCADCVAKRRAYGHA